VVEGRDPKRGKTPIFLSPRNACGGSWPARLFRGSCSPRLPDREASYARGELVGGAGRLHNF
jgi:hypothetical protein